MTLVVISIKLEKKILSVITNPVFPGRTTTDTMGEVAVGGEAGWREERAVMALSSFMFYSRVHISLDEVFSKILMKPSIVQKKIILHMKAKVVFIGKKQTNKKFWKKNSKWPTKKSSFSSSANSQYFFSKKSWIGPWVSRIDLCEGCWCGSTYMVNGHEAVPRKLKNSLKTQKILFLPVFELT